jgi:formylglycine-generating enzyme required for sulfatase activity
MLLPDGSGALRAMAAVEATDDAEAAKAQSRFALVVGISNAAGARSDTPLRNANAVAEKLDALGFDVDLAENLTVSQMRDRLRDLGDRRAAGDIVLFYFSGFDVQLGNRKLLLPVDAYVGNQGDDVGRAVAMADILQALVRMPEDAAKLVVLDTAPYPLRGKTRGLRVRESEAKGPANTFIALSNDTVGLPVPDGALSVFTASLVESLGSPGQPVETIFETVKVAVSDRTRGVQVPSHRSTLTQELLLDTPGQAAADRAAGTDRDEALVRRGIKISDQETPQASLENRPARGSETAQATERAPGFESALWSMIRESKNPADFEAYLEVFPSGQYSEQAQERLSALRAPSVPKSAAPEVEAMEAEYVLTTPANIRALPSTSASIVGKGEKGEVFQVTGRVVDKDWFRVQTRQGKTAYVSSRLLREAPQAAQKAAPKVAIAPPRVETAPPPAGGGDSFRDCPACPEMVSLPAGSFRMGSDSGDLSVRPAHTVRISKPFAIGRFEVTMAQWKVCVDAGGCSYKPRVKNVPDNSPVHKLSWKDVQEYIAWIRKVTGKQYRLPTEAEWEYAARGGVESSYWWGNRMAAGMADCKDCGSAWSYKFPAPVGSFKPNPFGLHGMNGGVWEWTEDCWRNDYDRAPVDGSAVITSSTCGARVLRGGSWRNDASYSQSTSRLRYDFNVRYSTNGFRVARDLP